MFLRSLIEQEARGRHRIHRHHKTSRPLSQDYELVGIAGEVQFEKDFGIPRDSRLLPGGDGRVDFTLGQFTFDPKAARSAGYIFREVEKQYADIIVQGRFFEDGAYCGVNWLGWAWSKDLLECPTRQFHPKGPLNHFQPIAECQRIPALAELIETEKRRLGWKLAPKREKQRPALAIAPGAKCGSLACAGCYEVDRGVSFHPPRAGWNQKEL